LTQLPPIEDDPPVLEAVVAAAAVGAVLIAAWNTVRSIEALERPFVVPHVTAEDQWRLQWARSGADTPQLSIPLRNVGNGAALLGDIQLESGGEQMLAQPGGQIPVFPDREPQRREFQLLMEPDDAPDIRGTLRIYFTHANGRRYLTNAKVLIGPPGVLCTSFRRTRTDGGERGFIFEAEPYPPTRWKSLQGAVTRTLSRWRRSWRAPRDEEEIADWDG
jgi:hypothetical protein